MEQIDKLWEYQQADLAADRFETGMRKSPTRVALKKNRDILLEQQEAAKKMEEDVNEMLDRVEVIKVASARLQGQLLLLIRKNEATPPTTVEEAQVIEKETQKLIRDVDDYEKEIRRIQKDASDKEKQDKEVRSRYTKAKAEYEQLKTAYDAELKEQTGELEAKRAEAAEKAKELDPALLAKYAAVKKHVTPAVAKLYNGQCGGCNMNLPQVSLRRFKVDTLYIECENCGRMIIQ